MGKNDELDEGRAAMFAWRTAASAADLIERIDTTGDDETVARAVRVRVKAREAALRAIQRAKPSTVPAIREALRSPYFEVRWRALAALDRLFPEAIEASDVLYLIEEAVIREPPPAVEIDDDSGHVEEYWVLLARVIVRTKPAGGAAWLARILDGECTEPWGARAGLDEDWAIEVMAEAYPEEALPQIDGRLRRVEWDRRRLATIAAACLPDELAWPRLLLAAADPVPEIASRARAAWMRRRASPCPVDEFAGVEIGLLEGPPSDRMRARLLVLRSGPVEARAAMTEVLLGERGDPEALALLLFAIADSGVWERAKREGMPSRFEGFVREIVERFGARGVRGVCAMAARFPEGRWGWLHALAEISCETAPLEIPEEARDAVRAAAANRLQAIAPQTEYAPLSLLAAVGAPSELLPLLWETALDPTLTGYLAEHAATTLAKAPSAEVDARLAVELRSEDLTRLAHALVVGLRRGSPQATEIARRLIESRAREPARSDRAVTSALDQVARELWERRLLAPSWMDDALAAPGTHAFSISARAYRQEISGSQRDALFAGLTSHPLSAVDAATTLVMARILSGADPRLPAIAARAPLPERAKLLWVALLFDMPPEPIWPLIEEILVSEDRQVTDTFTRRVELLARAGLGERIRAIQARVTDPGLAREIRDWQAHHECDMGYWKDEDGGDEGGC